MPANSTHWSTRLMAEKTGLSQSAIVRIWHAFGLQPHRVENFKFSKDPQFVEKVRDIVGLYLNPPDRAIVLCVDEKSQVQALNRTQPILPLAPGVPARQSHDYERHGVTSLFAAMDVASGVTISSCYWRHRHQEFLRFLNEVDASLPRNFDVHLVMDNYGTHKVTKVRTWLGAPSPISRPLHPNQRQLVESRRTVVRRSFLAGASDTQFQQFCSPALASLVAEVAGSNRGLNLGLSPAASAFWIVGSTLVVRLATCLDVHDRQEVGRPALKLPDHGIRRAALSRRSASPHATGPTTLVPLAEPAGIPAGCKPAQGIASPRRPLQAAACPLAARTAVRKESQLCRGQP
jgi:hypothetical protein